MLAPFGLRWRTVSPFTHRYAADVGRNIEHRPGSGHRAELGEMSVPRGRRRRSWSELGVCAIRSSSYALAKISW